MGSPGGADSPVGAGSAADGRATAPDLAGRPARNAPGEPVGLGWPARGALDPDGPGREAAPDGADVAATLPSWGDGVSRETAAAGGDRRVVGAGLGWAE